MSNSNDFSVCVNFIQLASGKWAGHTFTGSTQVSVNSFKLGECPERFKYEPCQVASQIEATEYWEIKNAKKEPVPYWYEDFDGNLCQGWN
jgi:hypothetical protein